MCAKVTGPLYSMGASGKIGDAMVFFGWKGLNVVRQWVTPVNKQSADQGDVRIRLGGLGRACGAVYPNTGHTVVSAFAQQLIDLGLVSSGQTKQSYLVKYMLDHYLTNNTTYATELGLIVAHTAYTSFGAAADTLGIVQFDLPYATIAPFNKALGIYLLAKSAIALGFLGTPYTVALTAWVATQIDLMVADFTAA
jgi:hypothetical protein